MTAKSRHIKLNYEPFYMEIGSLDREVYEKAGLALSWAQLFEAEIVNVLFLHGLARKKFAVRSDAEQFLRKSNKRPLRQKLDDVLSRVKFEPDIKPTLYEALEKRNFFVHEYFWERMEKHHSAEGQQEMIEELHDLTQLFYSARKFASLLTDLYAKQVGIDVDAISKPFRKNGQHNGVRS